MEPLRSSALDRPDALLTPRQLEVLELLAKGLTNGEIAGVLGIAPGTAKNHGGCGVGSVDAASLSLADVFPAEEAVIESQANGETMVRLRTLDFVSGTADLTADSLPVLDRFAVVFAAMPGARYAIEAHTDLRGAASDNLALSRDRADAVRDYLVDAVGGAPVAFTTEGFGEALPLVPGTSQAAFDANRRIEIFVEEDGGAPIFQVRVSADLLDVTADCDDFTSSPAAAAGDFFVQTGFGSKDDRGFVTGAEAPRTLFLADAGDLLALDLVAEERFFATDDAILEAAIDWYESDSGGARQFDLREVVRLQWDATARCWIDLDKEAAASRTKRASSPPARSRYSSPRCRPSICASSTSTGPSRWSASTGSP